MPPAATGDADCLAIHHRVRRIDDDVFISIQAGNHFDFAAEVVTQSDLLQCHLLALAHGGHPQTLGAEQQRVDRQNQ